MSCFVIRIRVGDVMGTLIFKIVLRPHLCKKAFPVHQVTKNAASRSGVEILLFSPI